MTSASSTPCSAPRASTSITDTTFNLLDFATDMRALSGKQPVLQDTARARRRTTSPSPATRAPQDVNIIDVPAIQQLVQSAFDPQPARGQRRGRRQRAEPRSAPPPRRHGRRLQRQPGRERPRRAGLAGARRARLQGRQGRELLRADADGTAGDPGLLRRRARRRTRQQIAVQFGATATALSTLPAGARRGADRLDRHPGARGHRAVEHADRGHPVRRARRSSARGPPRTRPRRPRRPHRGDGRQRHGRHGHGAAERALRHSLRVLTRRWVVNLMG